MGLAVDSLQISAEAAAAGPRRGGGRPFPKGQSGNPAGRKRGSKNKSTLAAQILLEGEAEALTRKAVEVAMGGNALALKLCLDRLFSDTPRAGRRLHPAADRECREPCRGDDRDRRRHRRGRADPRRG